jgi:putative addiction module killer protein
MDLLWYKLPDGREPARDFIRRLADPLGRKALLRRLNQIEAGIPGDQRHCREGLWEFRIHVGPGYRLYAGQTGADGYLILLAGSKRTQQRDIERALRWWHEFRSM